MGIDPGRFKRDEKKIDKSAWLDWLNDAPPAAGVQQEIRQKQVRQANTYAPRSAAPPVIPVQPTSNATPQTPASGVSIQINLPELHAPQFRRTKALVAAVRAWLTRQHAIRLAVAAAVLLLLVGGYGLLKHRSDQRIAQAAAQKAGANDAAAVVAQEKPTFTPAVPSNKQDLTTPDGKRSGYDPAKGSYSFTDDIGGKRFTVSQQQIPAGQKDTELVAKAAKSVNADTELKTGWGTAYLLTNQKYNSQTLVFSVKGLLVFISSSFTFTKDQWIQYINSLQ